MQLVGLGGQKSNHSLNKHIKSFLNLKMKHIKLDNPHVYILDNMENSINVDFSRLDKRTPWFFNTSNHFSRVNAYIAHYACQSYDTYIERKIKLPRDDTGTFREIINKDVFHSQDNNITNNTICEKYNAINKCLIEKITHLSHKTTDINIK